MEGGTMRGMSEAEMVDAVGGGFWSGFMCGVGIVTVTALLTSPDPFSKAALWSASTGTLFACVNAFS